MWIRAHSTVGSCSLLQLLDSRCESHDYQKGENKRKRKNSLYVFQLQGTTFYWVEQFSWSFVWVGWGWWCGPWGLKLNFRSLAGSSQRSIGPSKPARPKPHLGPLPQREGQMIVHWCRSRRSKRHGSCISILDRALIYLGQFDRSNGYLIHLNWGPIKHKCSNLNLNRPKLSISCITIAKLDVGPKENKSSYNHYGWHTKIQDHTSSLGVRILCSTKWDQSHQGGNVQVLLNSNPIKSAIFWKKTKRRNEVRIL